MAKKLTEDEMKWILSIDATEAQQAYHVLGKEGKELTKTNKSLRDRMNDLVSAGKKNSEEYRRLGTEVKSNNKLLDINKEKMVALEKTMGISNLTMSQLRRRAKDLQRQLDNTSMATDPQNYEKLSKELTTVRGRMDELKVAGKNTQDILSNSGGIIGKGSIAVALGNIYAKTVQWVAGKVKEIKDFLKEGTDKAGIQEGIQNAFNRVASSKDLQNLRKETKGLVKDFELMKAAVKAENFDIPLSQLGTYMAFAHQRAKDTGESVDYLVDSIVNGIGRKSPLILDNLGISASRLNAEVKKTGDFAGAVAKIVEEEMSKTGESIETAADIATRKTVAMENLQVNMGKRLVKLKSMWDTMTTSMAESLSKIIEIERSQKDEYTDQIKKVAELEVNTGSLINRYEELKKKTALSKDEQIELTKIINTLRSTVPGIVTDFDKYGNVLSVNTQKVWDFIDAEKAKLSVMNKGAIDEQTKKLTKYKEELERVDTILKSGKKDIMIQTSSTTWGSMEADLLPEDIAKYEDQKSRLLKDISGTQSWIEDMNGTTLENQLQTQKNIVEKRGEFNNMTQKQLEEYIKINQDAADKYVDIASEIYKNRFGTGTKPELEKKDVTNEVTALENKHAKELAVLKKQQMENLETEEEYNAKVYSLELQYQDKRIALLKNFRARATDKEIIVSVDKQIVESETKKLETQRKMQDQALILLKQNRDKALQAEADSYKTQRTVIEKNLAEQKITKEQYDGLILSLEESSAFSRLAVLEGYQTDVQALEFASGSLKATAIKEANSQVLDADFQAAQARANQQKKLQDLLKDFKTEFKLTTAGEETDLQLKALEVSYQARKEMAVKAGMDTTEIDQAFERAKTNILDEAEQERTRIRDQYGLVSLQEKYDLEIALLLKHHEQGLLSEEEFEKAKKNLRIKYQKDSFDYYKNLVSGAFNALQESELANIDAKYDAEIERAQGNADEVARLENEKEQKKLDVQKRYADINFAIKASEIIANTAVSIMKAYSELGPIAGSIAAALMGITGVAQLAIANSEREKIKNMTVGGSSSSSGAGKRVVTGKQTGGYIDVIREQDGKGFNAELDPAKRGYVDRPTVIVGDGPAGKSREWVASNDALENPTVAPIIQLLNESQERGEIRTVDMNQLMRKRLAGFESGGNISFPSDPSTSDAINSVQTGQLFTDEDRRILNAFILQLKNGVMAYVLRSELNKEAELLEKSKKIGSK